MMKKKYIAPEMILVEVNHTDVICTSTLQYGGNGGGIPAEAPEMRQRGSSWSDYEM